MASQLSTRQALQHIIDTARSISSECADKQTSTINLTHVATPSWDLHLPPEPPIDEALSALDSCTPVANKLSKAYKRYASQLRESLEARLRRMARFYALPIAGGNHTPEPAFDCVRDAAVQWYMRMLSDAADWTITSYRAHLRDSTISTSPRILKGISMVGPRLDHRTCSELRRSNGAKVPNLLMRATSEAVSSGKQLPVGFGTSVPVAKFPSQQSHQKLPIYALGNNTTNSPPHDQFGAGSAARAYPVRYTHPQAHRSYRFPSSGSDFFGVKRSHPTLRLTEGHSQDISIGLEKIRIEGAGEAARASERASVSTPPCTQSMFSRRGSSSRPPLRNTRATPIPTSTTASRPKIALVASSRQKDLPTPMPFVKDVVNPASNLASRQATPFTPLRVAMSRYGQSDTPLAPASITPTPQLRRRKLAPLPRRQPTSGSASHASPSSSVPSTTSHLEFRRSFTPASRASSFSSLPSSRAHSPASSDDNLDSPPTTPPISPSSLPPSTFASYMPDSTSLSHLDALGINSFCLSETPSQGDEGRKAFHGIVIQQ